VNNSQAELALDKNMRSRAANQSVRRPSRQRILNWNNRCCKLSRAEFARKPRQNGRSNDFRAWNNLPAASSLNEPASP